MIETAKNNEQIETVVKLIGNLVKVNPKSVLTEDSLLHLCVSKCNTIRSSYFVDEDTIVSSSHLFILLSNHNCY